MATIVWVIGIDFCEDEMTTSWRNQSFFVLKTKQDYNFISSSWSLLKEGHLFPSTTPVHSPPDRAWSEGTDFTHIYCCKLFNHYMSDLMRTPLTRCLEHPIMTQQTHFRSAFYILERSLLSKMFRYCDWKPFRDLTSSSMLKSSACL